MSSARVLISRIALVVTIALAVSAYGPYDYTNPEHVQDKLPIVEKNHFTPDVELLRRGKSSEFIVQDLAYTIRAFPNHHRALNSMARLWEQYIQKGQIPPGANPNQTPEYWFERARQFAPHDGVVPLLYGIHLHRLGKLDEALVRYKESEKLLPDSAEVHYNLGLLYVAKKEYGLAKRHARKAYELGYPLPGLRNKLIAVGVWTSGTKR
jgi:tetratricopeptide (TPR) repeat protein